MVLSKTTTSFHVCTGGREQQLMSSPVSQQTLRHLILTNSENHFHQLFNGAEQEAESHASSEKTGNAQRWNAGHTAPPPPETPFVCFTSSCREETVTAKKSHVTSCADVMNGHVFVSH